MKLTDVVGKQGWVPYPVGLGYKNLKVYEKGGHLLGVQKIGNVFRVDIQQCMDFGGMLLPGTKLLDNQIVPKEQLETALTTLLSD